jgi:hypothetical protein
MRALFWLRRSSPAAVAARRLIRLGVVLMLGLLE